MDRNHFAQLVKDALLHLYDPVGLQLSPLSDALAAELPPDTRGVTLHRVLLEAIDTLRPAPRVPADAPAWRPYHALHARYIEGMDVRQAAEELSLSPRQFRREHAKGIEVLTEQLWSTYLQRAPASNQADAMQRLPSAASADTESVAVDRLLDSEVARLGAPKGVDVSTPLRDAVEGVVATLRGLAAQQAITITVDLPQDLPSLLVERVVLRQMLFNIMVHLLSGGRNGAISITAAAQDHFVQLMFHQERRDRLLGLPARQEGDRLAVAERLVSLQGGQLQIEEDNGSRVNLALPVRQLPTVLVVDDNPDVILLFQRYLSGGVYRTIGATTGQQALQLAEEVLPLAILLDVMMPGQDGWELLQRFKNHPATAHVPIIVCSVLQERALALSLGAADFIAKPVSQQTLLATLRPYLSALKGRERRD